MITSNIFNVPLIKCKNCKDEITDKTMAYATLPTGRLRLDMDQMEIWCDSCLDNGQRQILWDLDYLISKYRRYLK